MIELLLISSATTVVCITAGITAKRKAKKINGKLNRK